jgi:hypothetical protein
MTDLFGNQVGGELKERYGKQKPPLHERRLNQ